MMRVVRHRNLVKAKSTDAANSVRAYCSKPIPSIEALQCYFPCKRCLDYRSCASVFCVSGRFQHVAIRSAPDVDHG